jgi:hypothetical protein
MAAWLCARLMAIKTEIVDLAVMDEGLSPQEREQQRAYVQNRLIQIAYRVSSAVSYLQTNNFILIYQTD